MTLTPRAKPTDPTRTVSAAVRELHSAVHNLIEPRTHRLVTDSGRTDRVTVPSLWAQISALVGSSSTGTGGAVGPKSRPTINIPAHDLRARITEQVRAGLVARALTPRMLTAKPGRAPLVALVDVPVIVDGDGHRVANDNAGQRLERANARMATRMDRLTAALDAFDVPANLRQLAAAVAGQDLDTIDAWVRTVTRWAADVEVALGGEDGGPDTRPLRGWDCPRCLAATVERVEDGETYRDPAVVAVFRDHLVQHIACRACQAFWWRGGDIDQLALLAYSRRTPMHTVTWTIGHGLIDAEFTCTAPPGSACRLACPSGCETVPCGHQLHDVGHCGVTPYLEGVDPADLYSGEPEPLRSGPIRETWDGARYTWSYAEPAPAADVAPARQAVSA